MSSPRKTLTVEAKANTHLTHLEELVLTQGEAGYQLARSFLLELIKSLGGNSNAKVNTSVKWDGAPAIFAGVNPDNGKFFVGTKSIFNKEPKLNYTKDDITTNHGHAPGLVGKLSRALYHLPQLGIENILQGDFMFDDDILKTTDIDGELHYTFKPNTIKYAVPVDSKLGEEISNAKFGIVFHTTYNDLQGGATAGADVSNLRRSPEIWFDDAFFKDDTGVVTLTTDEETEILDLIKKADSININYEDLPSVLLNTYINSEIRQGQFLDDSLKSFENFKNWYQSKIDKKVSTLKTERGQQRARQRGQEKINLFDSKSEDIVSLFDISRLLFKAKNIFITKYNNAVYNTKHFIDDGSGNLKATNPEGYVAVDHIGNGVKFVDRLEFSRANFAMDKGFTKESLNISESFTVVFGSEHKITKPINEWLLELQSPEGVLININEKEVAANSAEVYNLIMSGDPITSFLKKSEYVKPAIAGAIQYHLNEQYLKESQINNNPNYDIPMPVNERYVVLIPGGFKPPHKGHYSMIENYAKMPNVEAVVIISGDKPREGVTKEMSRQLFNLYGGLSNKIMFIDDNLPLRAAFEKLGEEEFVNQFSTEAIYTLGCSDKDGDEARAANFAKWFVRNPDKNILSVNVGALGACPAEASDSGALSASSMRKAARDGDDETLRAHVPDGVDLNAVKSILVKAIEGVRESFSLPFLESLVEEVIREETCEVCEDEEEIEEGSSMANGNIAFPPVGKKDDRPKKSIIRQENKNYQLFTTTEKKGQPYMISREDILAEQLLRELVRKAIKKTQDKSLEEEKVLRSVVRNLLKEEKAKQTIYPYTSLNVLAEFIKNQVYKPTSNFKSAYMTLSSSKEDRERFLQHILDLAREDMKRMDMNMEPLSDPGKEMEDIDMDIEPEAEEVEDDGPIVVSMRDLDAKGGVLGDEEEETPIPGEENLQEEDEDLISDTNSEAERDAVRNYANETYKGFGAALRRFYERVPDNVVKVNIGGQEQSISERELFSVYLEKNLIAHSSMAEQYMDSESSLTTSVPSEESDENNLGFEDEGDAEEDLDLNF